MFIDKVTISIRAGDGGNGAISFHREKFVSAGGPDGGDGGRGGNVVFRIDEGCNTLLSFRYHRKFAAENGENGKAGKKHGKNGEDVVISVPRGTLLKDAKTGKILYDMSSSEEDYIAAHGGRGGWGNRHFATPTRQIPRFAKNGTKGEEKELLLELKMLADVGLIGFPSVGKSSILAAISAARPKIAAYHFTTLSPNLGVVSLGEGKGYVAADIPGLIEGASEGLGLGHDFLRHIDRCRLLLHVVDISDEEGKDPIADMQKINAELALYSAALAERPQIVVANKCDAVLWEEESFVRAFDAYVRETTGRAPLYVSAVTGEGIEELKHAVAKALQELPPLLVYEPEISPEEAVRVDPTETQITLRDGVYYVEGDWIFNLMGQINFDDYESLNFFQRVLQKRGVFDKLREAGIAEGQTVNMYDFEFEFMN
ncbi:MAG: GTPase ObgE [Clostridia bacterium]|nr:GTPase ObgE [Clostridia bacterium]